MIKRHLRPRKRYLPLQVRRLQPCQSMALGQHSCARHYEAREKDGRIFIHALRDIVRGEELNYDYG